jgi:hypothetical protein
MSCATSRAIKGVGDLKKKQAEPAENQNCAGDGEGHQPAEAIPHPLVIGEHVVIGGHLSTPLLGW